MTDVVLRGLAGLAVVALALVLLRSPGSGAPAGAAQAAGPRDWTWDLPKGFPQPRVPKGSPMSEARVQVGRWLFHDKRLSANRRQSCATCHVQSLAFTDGRATAVGSTGQAHPRNTPSLGNVAYAPTLTWANPALVTLERQVEVPLFGTDPVELGLTDRTKPVVLKRLRGDARYRRMFARAFPRRSQPITWPAIVQSLAAFQRSLISGDSRYDRYVARKGRLTQSERRGADLFFGERAECFHCHGGFTFSDQVTYAGAPRERIPFHNTGLFNTGGTGAFPEPNRGVFELTGRPEDMGAFRAPSLRNVAVTAPYMHDGSMRTLREVVDFYAAGGRVIPDGPHAGDGRASPFRDPLVAAITLGEQDRRDLVAFLTTLTDRGFLTDPRFSDPFRPSRRR
ncbi:MAG: MbnH family di-heme enzyme [Thermoleophilia bacterium]